MEHYDYEPIDLERPALRLIRLFKGQELTIECELFQAFLDEDDLIPYEALSYTWGGTATCASIQVNGKTLGITENLFLALQYLRFNDTDRILWVDAVCINQSNNQERGHQVQQMGNIYSRADQVVFWLGAATDDTDALMDSLKRLEEQSLKYPCKKWKLADERWEQLWSVIQSNLETQHWKLATRQRVGLTYLFYQPWFTRIWILQEVANARKAIICSGFKSVSARIFGLAPRLLDIMPDDSVQAVLDIMPGPSRESSWWRRKRNLSTLLQKFKKSYASDPRDRIYALLGICSDITCDSSLKVGYSKNLKQVIRDTATFLFVKSNFSFKTIEELADQAPYLNLRLFEFMYDPNDTSIISDLLNSQKLPDFSWDEILGAVANITTAENPTLRLLFEDSRVKIAEDSFKDFTSSWNVCSMKILVDMRGHELNVTEEVLEAAARNPNDAYKMMDLLLAQKDNNVKITENLLIAATKNKVHGDYIFDLLLTNAGHDIELTEKVISAIDRAKGDGPAMRGSLYRHHPEFRIHKKVLRPLASKSRVIRMIEGLEKSYWASIQSARELDNIV